MDSTTRPYQATKTDLTHCDKCGELNLPLTQGDPLCSWCRYKADRPWYRLPTKADIKAMERKKSA